MNYLAHCYLSCSEEDILIGNIITDFMSKKEESNYSDKVLEGIHLHRQIDTYTDKHPASLELKGLLRKRHGKYASVVVDLVWDHFLCLNWDHFSGSPISDFCQEIYPILLKRKSELPPKFSNKIESMVANNFLMSYATDRGMLKSLQWMDNRVNFKSNFVGAISDVEENREVIQGLFMAFFPDLIAFVEGECGC